MKDDEARLLHTNVDDEAIEPTDPSIMKIEGLDVLE
jgi:hypothetical protein